MLDDGNYFKPYDKIYDKILEFSWQNNHMQQNKVTLTTQILRKPCTPAFIKLVHMTASI